MTTHVPTTTAADLVARFFRDVLNRENPPAVAELVAADFVVHHPLFAEGTSGQAIMGTFLGGFSDLRYKVEEIIADGDRAVVRWRATGTHSDEFFGIARTGRRVTVVGADVFHAADGRLTETWVNSDMFGLFRQLGQFPQV